MEENESKNGIKWAKFLYSDIKLNKMEYNRIK